MIIDDEYEEIVLDDFEDLMPPQWEKLPLINDEDSVIESLQSSLSSVPPWRRLTRENKRPKSVDAQTEDEAKTEVSDCSSDVVIIEDCDLIPRESTQKPIRVLRTRLTNIPKRANRRLPRHEKNRRSTQPKVGRLHHLSKQSPSDKQENGGLTNFTLLLQAEENTAILEAPFEHASLLPSAHDMVEALATIGCALVSSARPVFPTIRLSDAKNHHSHHVEQKEAQVQRSFAVFSRVQARANNGGHSLKRPRNMLTTAIANFNLRHPFLFPWEKDEDRLASGEWRTRRECYWALQSALEEQEKNGEETFSDVENAPPTPLEPRKRAFGKRKLAIPNREFSPNKSDDLLKGLPTLEPYLLGYRWTPMSEQPDKMLLWR